MVTNTADWGAAMVSGQMVELVMGELPVSCEPKLYQKPSLFPWKWKSIFTDHFFTDHFFTIIFPYWFIAWSGLCEII